MTELEIAEYRAETDKCLACCGKIHEWVVANVGNLANKANIRGKFYVKNYVYSWSVCAEGLHMAVGALSLASSWSNKAEHVKVGGMFHERGWNKEYKEFISMWPSIKEQIVKEFAEYKSKCDNLDTFVA